MVAAGVDAVTDDRAGMAAERALRKYLDHLPGCASVDFYGPDNARCDCGLKTAIRAAESAAEAKGRREAFAEARDIAIAHQDKHSPEFVGNTCCCVIAEDIDFRAREYPHGYPTPVSAAPPAHAPQGKSAERSGA